MRKAEAEKEDQSSSYKPLNPTDIFSSDEESSSGSESSSSNADSEDEQAVGGKSLSALRREHGKSLTSLEQLSKVKLSRYRLEKWEPYCQL